MGLSKLSYSSLIFLPFSGRIRSFMNERLSLPRPSYVENLRVDDETLLPYLMSADDSCFRGPITFASSLDLGNMEQFLRELATSEKLGYVESQEARDVFESAPPFESPIPDFHVIEEERKQKWRQILYDQQPVERGRTVYYDIKEGKYMVTDITHGEFARYQTETFDLLGQGHRPLFELHTHPANRLFSDADFYRMILARTKDLRPVKATIVICPDVQILAIATPETLALSREQLEEFIARHDLNNSDAGRRITEINTRIGELINECYFRKTQAHVDGVKNFSKECGFYVKGLYSEEEFNSLKEDMGRAHFKMLRNFVDKYFEEIALEMERLESERNQLYLRCEMEAIREVRPKLYIARDFRHFQEFVA